MQPKTHRTEHQIGKYKLVRLIAEGGMGQVYEALHVELGRRAAIKLLRPDIALNEETTARFFNEARAASFVAHAGLVQVHEYGHLDDGGAYIVMEYVQGEVLRERLQKCGGRLPVALAIPVARQIASALHAAHEKGIVHRDLKPENVKLVPDDEAAIGERAKVLDFGVAKLLSSEAGRSPHQTLPGQLLGTPVYMAPEQAGAGGGIGPHTDVYALGVVLFELLSGHPPFVGEEATQLIGQHLFVKPPLLRAELSDADPALDELLQRMLAKGPELRPNMQSVANELGQIERRLRLKISGSITDSANSHQIETVVFRRVESEGRFDSVRRLLKSGNRRWVLGGAGILAAILVSAGMWLIFKKPSVPVVAPPATVAPVIARSVPKARPDGGVELASSDAPKIAEPAREEVRSEKPQLPQVTSKQRVPAVSQQRSTERRTLKAASYNPKDVAGTLSRAQDYLEMGQYNNAIELAQSVQTRSPTQAWRIIGLAACGRKRIDLANESYNRLDPTSQRNIMNACRLSGVDRTVDGFQLRKP